MKYRYQWRTLTANSHVESAQVSNGRYAGNCCDRVWVTDLDRKRRRSVWCVVDRLPMVPDRGNLMSIDAALFEQCARGRSKSPAGFDVE